MDISNQHHSETLKTNKTKQGHRANLIYTLLQDDSLAQEIATEFEKHSFSIVHYHELSAIQSACKNNNSVLIIDAAYKENDICGVDIIGHLKNNIKSCPPIIYISDSDDAESRLAAVHANVDRYFCKPVRLNKLIHTVKGLIAPVDTLPYRVMIIDNDVHLLECYRLILSESGLISKAISEPLKAYAAIKSFKPDVIVVDMYMPDCSGAELVSMIRQDDRWASIPVIFLSGEEDINSQLEAMSLGADDFLVKPINAKKLVATITTAAKRARKNKKLQQDLKNSLRESKYQLVTLDQHAIVSITDVAGRIIHVNDKLCEISGFYREELLGENHRILKSQHHDNLFYKELWNTISNGKVWHGVICNRKKDGDEYWVDSTIVPFIDEKGKPYKYVSVRTDVTELRANEHRLKRSQEFANIGTWDWDIVSSSFYWSERIWPLFGYSKETIETNYDNFFTNIHPDDIDNVLDAITNCIESEANFDIEHRVVWPDGSEHWLHQSGDVLRDKEGNTLHMLGVVRDITVLKLAEKELVAAREEAENANHAKSQFLSSMSHELRTPMNAILGFGQLLKITKSQPLTEVQEKNVDEIVTAGLHLMDLINDVLDLTKIESGHIDLSINKVDLGNLLIDALNLITPLALNRGIEILLMKNGIEIELGELVEQKDIAFLDATRFKQIILNLLSNAVKYNNENGKIILAYDLIENDVVRFSVKDTGKGLSLEQQQGLFKTFNRLGMEQTEIEGTGIGLVITKKIVKLMGGEIGLNSEVGKGSTFWVKLPRELNKQKSEDANKNTKATSLENLSNSNASNLKYNKSVLYIEDNPANLRLVEQILSVIPKLHMWSAPEPLLGLELAMEHLPDLILLDINLPGMNGFEVLRKLKSNDKSKDIPIIAISANAMPNDIKKAEKAGFDYYITKPVKVKELLSVVESKLTGKNND